VEPVVTHQTFWLESTGVCAVQTKPSLVGVLSSYLVVCVQAAQGAGMLSVAVPPALSARGRFPAAQVTFDGFGYGGGLNWPRLQMLLDKRLAGKV